MRRTWLIAAAVLVSPPASLHSQLEPRPSGTLTIMSSGPAPTGAAVSGTPTVATVTWQPVAGAVRYTVSRVKDGDAVCCNAQSGSVAGTSWIDNGGGSGIQWPGTYTYTVSAWQADGTYGNASVKWARPDPLNPSGFSAKQTGEGTAELSWQGVPYASYYWIWGAGTGSEGVRADGTTKTFSGIGSGMKEWSITTRYDPAGVLLPSSSWPKTQLNMVTRTGMYRITLNGFEVAAQAEDDRLGIDGWGNEILSVNYIRVFDRASGRLLKEGPVESSVHGDTEGFQGRVPAGTARATGGLVTGNKFPGNTPWMRNNSVSPTTFPLLLWEGPLTDGGEAVVVTPMIFEWESQDRMQVDGALNKLREITSGVWSVIAPVTAGPPTAGPVQMDLNPWNGWGPLSDRTVWGWTHVIGGTEVHPVDKKSYYAKHIGVVITREMIEAALSGQQIGAYGPGVIPVRWADKANNGNYVLFLQVARQ